MKFQRLTASAVLALTAMTACIGKKTEKTNGAGQMASVGVDVSAGAMGLSNGQSIGAWTLTLSCKTVDGAAVTLTRSQTDSSAIPVNRTNKDCASVFSGIKIKDLDTNAEISLLDKYSVDGVINEFDESSDPIAKKDGDKGIVVFGSSDMVLSHDDPKIIFRIRRSLIGNTINVSAAGVTSSVAVGAALPDPAMNPAGNSSGQIIYYTPGACPAGQTFKLTANGATVTPMSGMFHSDTASTTLVQSCTADVDGAVSSYTQTVTFTGGATQDPECVDLDPAKVLASQEVAKCDGTKVMGLIEACKEDATVGCLTTQTHKSADLTNLQAGNILIGVTIAGVSGSVTPAPADCSSAGEQACVATGTYFAGAACDINGSACYLPTYEQGSQNKKAIDFSTIDATKMLTTSTVSGVVGTIASQGSWAITEAFPGTGYYTGVSATPSAGTMLSGTTVNAIAGTATAAPPDCSTNGATGCVTTSTYQSGDLTTLTEGNIKNGTTIAGVVGLYPNATYKLPSASGTADLENANFDAQVKSATAFEYWNSAGARQTGAGDADITAANIADGVSIFGTTGTITSPIAWDLRVGSSIVTPSGTVTGKLKVNCRNRVNLTRQDMDLGRSVSGIASNILTTTAAHGLTNNQAVRLHFATAPVTIANTTTYYVILLSTTTFSLSMTTTGSAPGPALTIAAYSAAGLTVHKWLDGTADIWDTIDDYNANAAGLPPSIVTAWGNNTDCGGVETTADDANVWKDVTTTGDGTTTSTCAATSGNCTMKDKITGLHWSKLQALSSWSMAVQKCDTLIFNAKDDWRLPTQKELMEAYTHGIRSAASIDWIPVARMSWSTSVWSTTSVSDRVQSAYPLSLGMPGQVQGWQGKEAIFPVVCVRP